MTAAQMLADESQVYSDFPSELITVSGVQYQCQEIRGMDTNYLADGGIIDQPTVLVAVDRNAMPTAPANIPKLTVTFRGASYRLDSIDDNDPQAPIQLTLKSTVDER